MANIKSTLVETSRDGVDRSMTRVFATQEDAEEHNRLWRERNEHVISFLEELDPDLNYTFEYEETDEEVR